MAGEKARRLWRVNVLSFILFAVLALTGLLNWLVLPHGYHARGTALAWLRHLVLNIHEWAAVLFIAVIAYHLLLHRKYIQAQLKK